MMTVLVGLYDARVLEEAIWWPENSNLSLRVGLVAVCVYEDISKIY